MSAMQAELWSVVRAVRVRDCVLVVVCALSVYLLRARDSFELQPVWRKSVDPKSSYQNGRYPSRREHLPHPVLTDLDNDGHIEIVLVTGDLELQVCSVPQSETTGNMRRLPNLVVRESVELVADKNDAGSHRPVVLETGYLFPAISELQQRTQVIVVLFDDWSVHCYDEHLRLLWNQVLLDVANHPSRRYDVRAAGILVAPHVLRPGDNGTVIVGASFVHASHNLHAKSKRDANDVLVNKHVDDQVSDDLNEEENSLADERLTHLSTFALNGADGKIRWHHLPGDFEQDKKEEVAPFHWKLGLKKGRWHVGEVHWTKYASGLLKHLPHAWRDVTDTRLDLVDLRRSHVVKSGIDVASNGDDNHATLAPLSDIIGLDTEHIIGQAYGGMRPHSRHEHVKWPNAVVIHHDAGIQVLSLATGQPITQLQLNGRSVASVFADVNDDDHVEEIRPDFVLKCQIDISSVYPRPHALYSGPLCESPFWMGGVGLANLFQTTDVVNEDTHVTVTPAVVPRVAQGRGIINHLQGRNLPSEQTGFDSIFLTSTGRLTSYSPAGEPNWQSVLSTSWSHVALQSELTSNFASSDYGELYLNAFKPSLAPFALQLYGKKSSMLVSGWDMVAVVDLRDGFVSGQHSLPCQPIDSPVVGDFDNDGLNEFIVTCAEGYIGFEIVKGSTLVYTLTVTATVILAVLLLMWCCVQRDTSDDDDERRRRKLGDRFVTS